MKKKLSPLTFILLFLFVGNTLNATNYSNDNTIGDPIKIIRSNQRLMLFCNNKITFELGSQKLNESTRYELGLIASRLIKNPNLKIEIGVFNDTRSDVDFSK
jgi:flagellar motor protein MotB